MNNEIPELNKWLLNQSTKCWKEYYLVLIDINLKSNFRISSCDCISENPLRSYLEKHKSEYIIFPGTGSCQYIKL